MKYRELLLGCGYRRERVIDPYMWKSPNTDCVANEDERWKNVTAIDVNATCKPDYVIDIDQGLRTIDFPQSDEQLELFVREDTPRRTWWRFRESLFAEVHAYEVLEHIGQQGDYEAFFRHFDDIWHVLRPGGWLCASVPSRFSPWFWGDPGHCRAILPETLLFLHRPHYVKWLGNSPSSDYRSMFDGDWDIVHSYDNEANHNFVLQAVKPPRNNGP